MNRWHQDYLKGAYRNQKPRDLYAARLGTVQDALDLIEDGDCIIWASHGSEPKGFLSQLHTIAPRLNKGVECWTCIDRYEYPVASDPSLAGKFHINTFFYDRWSIGARGSGLYSYFPVNQHNYGQEIQRSLKPNVFVGQVSPMDKRGYVHLSCDLIMTLENLYRADKIIFEVNARAPMVWGENALPVSMADVIYEVDEPIYELSDPPIGEKERTIAGYVSEMMKDGDCIQLGFGGIPNAIGFSLMDKHDMGIHTEQIGTSMAHLMEAGAVTNRYKKIDKGITVGSFISGDAFLYEFVDQHPRLCVKRSRYTNDPYVIAQNDNVVSINASLQIDLTGQVCAESIGPLQHSGTGGATDFAWGAYHSKGGRAILAQTSTTRKGTLSRIVPTLDPGAIVSVSRNLTDMVVTEYGVAKLRQRTVKQRVENLIAVAHPDFRAELRKKANAYMYY
ncbi:MAG: acetyl-CoA hydrolase/transferase C-terminal domain-containing protein [Evtepia sp.]|uniref:acetyl-CoA hydrolase/transferase family protein n=1 Tax=Evtepia sp. TaxID=2773933 RepID=UPI002A75A88B|nr:acetyl-CoA hydrolase/transferase C-terminal domain-containing protein [Evtepia sp.]MDY3013709.1 acetyl-CoA hydrolase/transferase C-terminal domain-containing protein [Evtepia sp.]